MLPFFGEQETNCMFYCKKWEIGLEIEDVKKDTIESLVRELMDGEKGKETRDKGLQWKELAKSVASGPDGSSFLNLENMFVKFFWAKLLKICVEKFKFFNLLL